MRILLYFRQNITHQYDVRIELKVLIRVAVEFLADRYSERAEPAVLGKVSCRIGLERFEVFGTGEVIGRIVVGGRVIGKALDRIAAGNQRNNIDTMRGQRCPGCGNAI